MASGPLRQKWSWTFPATITADCATNAPSAVPYRAGIRAPSTMICTCMHPDEDAIAHGRVRRSEHASQKVRAGCGRGRCCWRWSTSKASATARSLERCINACWRSRSRWRLQASCTVARHDFDAKPHCVDMGNFSHRARANVARASPGSITSI